MFQNKFILIGAVLFIIALTFQADTVVQGMPSEQSWYGGAKRTPAAEEALRELEDMFGNMQRPRFGRSAQENFEKKL
uniref:Uncharacterized protein n=1 Tax=Romanomermis culicivorax TaxID=13658 RepID=A0A915HV82_ROMCU